MECPKCNSDEIRIIGTSYPNSYECKKCGHVFIKGKNALIDD